MPSHHIIYILTCYHSSHVIIHHISRYSSSHPSYHSIACYYIFITYYHIIIITRSHVTCYMFIIHYDITCSSHPTPMHGRSSCYHLPYNIISTPWQLDCIFMLKFMFYSSSYLNPNYVSIQSTFPRHVPIYPKINK